MALSKKSTNFYIGTFLLFVLAGPTKAYEKTLRKMVRSQSKMVQRPFDDMSGVLASSHDSVINPLNFQQGSRGSPVRTLFYRTARPVVSLVAPGVVTRGHSHVYPHCKGEKPKSTDFRLVRNIFPNASKTMQDNRDLFFFEQNENNRSTWNVQFQGMPRQPFSIFPPVNDDDQLQTIELTPRTKDTIVTTPENLYDRETNDSFHVKEIIIAKLGTDTTVRVEPVEHSENSDRRHQNYGSPKTNNLIEVTKADASTYESYNLSIDGSQICALLKTTRTNIETQKRFSEFNIEPPWMSKNHFWDSIFNRRYEFLMRNKKWPPLKVILIPRAHVDTIWENTFENNNNSANRMLSNIVKKMNFYPNLTFTWTEISHLSEWWRTTTYKSRTIFRKMLKEKRLEITTGCWVESDEATTHIFGLVHNLIQGHQWLAEHLIYSPEVAWLTNTVTHSPTMVYLLSMSGITKLIFTNVHYSWEEYFAEYQISDFIWVQNWNNGDFHSSELNKLLKRIGKDRYPSNSVISHYLQFNADGFEACGPNRRLCTSEFDFMGSTKLLNIHEYNIKDKSELLLEQYSKTGTLTPHNIIMAPLGGPHHFETQAEFDYQYNNYLRIAEFTNVNREIYKATMQFGTPLDYFNSIFEKNVSYPSLKGDFAIFADVENSSPTYKTGFFTSRPLLKILLRRIQSTLRSTEILFSFTVMRSYNSIRNASVSDTIKLLTKSRETVARLLDRNVISGTLSANALRYVHEKILVAAKDCWRLQEILISSLTNKERQKPYVKKYVYRHGEFISAFRTIGPGDHVLMFNSMSHVRYEVVEFFTKTPNIKIIDRNEKVVTIQVNPVWKLNSKDVIVISKRFFKIMFAVVIPPLTIELFKIMETFTAKDNLATIYCVMCTNEEYVNSGSPFSFNINPIEKGDIQLESFKHRLIIDETSGFLKAVVEKDSNTEKMLAIDYGAFTSSLLYSERFLSHTNMTKPVQDILLPYRAGYKSKSFIIVTGQLTTECTAIFGRLLQHTIKIFHLLDHPLSSAIYTESKFDLDATPNIRDVELFMSIQTDINNGDLPEIFTDNNGFQYTLRTVNLSRRIESNVYPITTLSFIQDHKQRLTILTDHAQGVTALQEGQLIVMLDRRLLLDNSRDTEGLADVGTSCQRHYILLENFIQGPSKHEREVPHSKALQLPSFRANYLSNTLNYDLELFIIENNESGDIAHAYIPLVNAVFPCDITLLNYRAVIDSIAKKPFSATAALMILHRQSFTCHINYDALVHCNVEPEFSIAKILENIRSVLKTNLAGTDKGMRINYINLEIFPPMELLTLRIHF